MLNEGDKAPAFKLPTYSGESISLSDFKGKAVVLYFYPKDMTPGCTQQACDFRDGYKKFEKKGAVVLGVSADSADRHEKFRDKYKLTFLLLADEAKEVCKAYGVWKKKSLYGREFMGIERTTFIIDKAGKISKIYRKVKVKDHTNDVLEAIP